MYSGKMIFSQIMDFLPLYEFQKCVNRYQGNYKMRNFSCLDQFLCMSFAQLTFRESLRDIEACLRSAKNKLYHMGIRGNISRSTLSDANNLKDWRIYADFAKILITKARNLYKNEDLDVELEKTVYALDSTTIELCLSVFPWAAYCRKQAGIKLHSLLDIRGSIPSVVDITSVKVHDVNFIDLLIPEIGAFYIMDRGYLSFERLYALHKALAFFIIRSKKNIHYRRIYSHIVDKTLGLRCDQTIVLTGKDIAEYYPDKLRKIVFYDKEQKRHLILFTNNFTLNAYIITQLYKQRWKIELFFKWIKQHLRIKKFYGISENAVKTQIWIAISVYVLIAIIKKQLKIEINLYTILQILSVSPFEKVSLQELLMNFDYTNIDNQIDKQLSLFNL